MQLSSRLALQEGCRASGGSGWVTGTFPQASSPVTLDSRTSHLSRFPNLADVIVFVSALTRLRLDNCAEGEDWHRLRPGSVRRRYSGDQGPLELPAS